MLFFNLLVYHRDIIAYCFLYQPSVPVSNIHDDLLINYTFIHILFFSFHAGLPIKFFYKFHFYLKLPFSNSETQRVFAGHIDTTMQKLDIYSKQHFIKKRTELQSVMLVLRI